MQADYLRGVPKLQARYCQYITDAAGRQLLWLDRLSKRLEAHRVTQLDPLLIAVRTAYNAMHAVRIHSMYGAMARPRDPTDPLDDPETEATAYRIE